MSILAAVSALFFLAATLVAVVERGPTPSILTRLLFAVGGALGVPSWFGGGTASLAAVGLGAVVVARPLAGALAASAALVLTLSPGAWAPGARASWVLGLAVAAGAAAVEWDLAAGGASVRRRVATSAVVGLVAASLVASVDGGAPVHWQFALRSPVLTIPMPGTGLVLGLGLLACLVGGLVQGVAVLTDLSTSAAAFGRRALLIAVALVACGTGVVVARAISSGTETSEATAGSGAGLLLATTLLAVALIRLLAGSEDVTEPAAARSKAELAGHAMVVLAVLGAAGLGLEAHWTAGTYAVPSVAEAAACALLALAALPAGRGAMLRRGVALASLAVLLARPVLL